MVGVGAGRRLFILAWIEGGFIEMMPLAWVPGMCTGARDSVWER